MLPALDAPLGALHSIEVFATTVHMADPIRFAAGTHAASRRVFLRVCTSDAEGFGEVAALERPVGADPSLDQVCAALDAQWLGRLADAATARAGACPASGSVGLFGSSTSVDRVCAAALEMAILDAELRLSGQSLGSWLEVESATVPFGGVLGIPDDENLDLLIAAAAALLEDGAQRLRVKIRPGFATAPLGALRAAFPSVALQADANGSFTKDDLDELAALDEFGLLCLEEPLEGRDFAAAAQLAGRLATPVCLDESIQSPRHAADALRYEAASVLCLKPGRLGGLRQVLACQEVAEAQGASWFIGGLFEAGLGRAFLGAVAAQNHSGFVSDVVAPSAYLVEDPCGLIGPEAGTQPLWNGPGVGPWPTGSLEPIGSWHR